MSERGQQEYLADMREAIVRIQTYTSTITYGQFLADHKTQDAVIRNIEILGEAAKHVPATLTRTYPEIAWKSIAGMRDKLVHDYFGVNLDILHVSATVCAAGRRSQCPKAPLRRGPQRGSRVGVPMRGRSERERAHLVRSARHAESIDGAEHSGRIERVMAGRHAAA